MTPTIEHHLLEALWVHQFHDVVNVELLDRLLTARDFRARAAATRVLCYWRDRVPDALERLKKLAADPLSAGPPGGRPRRQLLHGARGVEVPLITAEHPSDYYLDYTRGETMRALEPYVKKALAEGRPIEITSAAGARFFLRKIDTDSLLKMKRNRGVLQEILFRKGVREEVRRQALADLARLTGKPEPKMLIDALRDRDSQRGRPGRERGDRAGPAADRSRPRRTGRGPRRARAAGDQAQLPVIRQFGFAALIAADGSAEPAWALALAIGPVPPRFPGRDAPDPRPQPAASLYPKVEPLLHRMPASLSSREDRRRGPGTRPPRRDERPDLHPRPGGAHLPGSRAIRPRRTSTATPRSWPCRRFPPPTGPPRRPGRSWRA